MMIVVYIEVRGLYTCTNRLDFPLDVALKQESEGPIVVNKLVYVSAVLSRRSDDLHTQVDISCQIIDFSQECEYNQSRKRCIATWSPVSTLFELSNHGKQLNQGLPPGITKEMGRGADWPF